MAFAENNEKKRLIIRFGIIICILIELIDIISNIIDNTLNLSSVLNLGVWFSIVSLVILERRIGK